MRVMVFSDIHANLMALKTALDHAGPVDQYWCLGDVVGYGPNPDECVSTLRSIKNLFCIMGNHDAAVCDQIPIDAFNPEARESIFWTRSHLSNNNLEWLNQLPERLDMETGTMAHGSPRNPIWEYLLDAVTAALNFKHFSPNVCFVGHTHLPVSYQQLNPQRSATWYIPPVGEAMPIKGRMIINPGSIGQPRDHDPRSAYGIYDTDQLSWEARRIEYNIQEVQQRIFAANLPEKHAVRLTIGW